jgi:hypothetical protein
MLLPSLVRSIALAIGVASVFRCALVRAVESPCVTNICVTDDTPSWIFGRSSYTHDPYTGARVAQYMRTPPVEPLDDPRLVTSRYRRSRTVLRGANGSVDTYYEVQAWGNGRGGIDAEWERFHNAWKESYLSGGYYNQAPAYGPWGYGGYVVPSYGGQGSAFPNGGFHGSGHGPWYGQTPHWEWQHGQHSGGVHGGGGHYPGDRNQRGEHNRHRPGEDD